MIYKPTRHGKNSELIEKQAARITALEDVLKKLTDLGDGYYVRWETVYKGGYEPYCIYCDETWDRTSDTDAHKDNCPIAIARKLLAED